MKKSHIVIRQYSPDSLRFNIVEPQITYTLSFNSAGTNYIIPSLNYLKRIRTIHNYEMKDALIHIQMQLN